MRPCLRLLRTCRCRGEAARAVGEWAGRGTNICCIALCACAVCRRARKCCTPCSISHHDTWLASALHPACLSTAPCLPQHRTQSCLHRLLLAAMNARSKRTRQHENSANAGEGALGKAGEGERGKSRPLRIMPADGGGEFSERLLLCLHPASSPALVSVSFTRALYATAQNAS